MSRRFLIELATSSIYPGEHRAPSISALSKIHCLSINGATRLAMCVMLELATSAPDKCSNGSMFALGRQQSNKRLQAQNDFPRMTIGIGSSRVKLGAETGVLLGPFRRKTARFQNFFLITVVYNFLFEFENCPVDLFRVCPL